MNGKANNVYGDELFTFCHFTDSCEEAKDARLVLCIESLTALLEKLRDPKDAGIIQEKREDENRVIWRFCAQAFEVWEVS